MTILPSLFAQRDCFPAPTVLLAYSALAAPVSFLAFVGHCNRLLGLEADAIMIELNQTRHPVSEDCQHRELNATEILNFFAEPISWRRQWTPYPCMRRCSRLAKSDWGACSVRHADGVPAMDGH